MLEQVLPKTPLHAFALPFYDTNIAALLEKPQHRSNSEVCAGYDAFGRKSEAHGIMQMGTMNPMQNYQMQALLRPGHWAQDGRVGYETSLVQLCIWSCLVH